MEGDDVALSEDGLEGDKVLQPLLLYT